MAYTKTNWEDLPSTNTPIDTTNLQNMEDGIESAHIVLDALKETNDNNVIYSTDERIVGTFFDDKPLYRKDFYITEGISSVGTFEFAHNIQNVDFIKVKEANIFNLVNKTSYTLPITLYNSHSSSDNLSVSVNDTKIMFYMQSGWGNQWLKLVTLEYTKTTD